MITESMQLNSYRDAQQWASDLGDLTAAQQERVADWIWDNKPEIGCTYEDFCEQNADEWDGEKFWEIAGDENHDDYNDAIAAGAEIVEYDGKQYAMTRQAELSNRVFPGWFGDADEGGNYTAEYSAPAVGTDGRDYKIIWQFDEVRGEEPDDGSNYDWYDIHDVVLA